MKRKFLTVLTLGFFAVAITACQSEKKSGSTDSTTVDASKQANLDSTMTETDSAKKANKVIEPTATEIAKAQVAAPDFSDASVNEGLKEFEGIKASYETALKNKDAAAIKAAKEKFGSWVSKAATWGSKVEKDQNQKYIDYYEKLVQQWNIVERQASSKK